MRPKSFGSFEKQDSMPVQCSAAEAQQTAKIKSVSIGRSIEISLIWSHISTIYGLVIDPAVGLIAQRVEHCTGITEVRVRVPLRPEFSRLIFSYCLHSAAICEGH